jgi:hypothetical protein
MASIVLGPAALDFSGIRAGDLNLVTFTITQAGVPVDLTGKVLTAQVRLNITDPDPAIEAEILITDAVNGAGTIRWDGEEVRTLLAGAAKWSGVWDMQAADPGVDPITLVAGKWSAELDVTR